MQDVTPLIFQEIEIVRNQKKQMKKMGLC